MKERTQEEIDEEDYNYRMKEGATRLGTPNGMKIEVFTTKKSGKDKGRGRVLTFRSYKEAFRFLVNKNINLKEIDMYKEVEDEKNE